MNHKGGERDRERQREERKEEKGKGAGRRERREREELFRAGFKIVAKNWANYLCHSSYLNQLLLNQDLIL